MQFIDDFATWLDRHHVVVLPLLISVGLLILATVVILLLKRLLQRWLTRIAPRLGLPYHAMLTITRLVTGALWAVALLLILESWGISLGGFWTLVVSAAAVVGVGFLATWAMISNVTARVFIAIWHPFHLGDTVEVLPEGLKGRVIDINLMFVLAREDSGAVLQIPNNLFFQKMFRVRGSAAQSLFEALEAEARVDHEQKSG